MGCSILSTGTIGAVHQNLDRFPMFQDIGNDSILFDIYEIFRILKYKLNFKNTLLGFNKRETLSYHKIRTDISNMLNIMKINTKAKVKRVARNTFYLYPLER